MVTSDGREGWSGLTGETGLIKFDQYLRTRWSDLWDEMDRPMGIGAWTYRSTLCKSVSVAKSICIRAVRGGPANAETD